MASKSQKTPWAAALKPTNSQDTQLSNTNQQSKLPSKPQPQSHSNNGSNNINTQQNINLPQQPSSSGISRKNSNQYNNNNSNSALNSSSNNSSNTNFQNYAPINGFNNVKIQSTLSDRFRQLENQLGVKCCYKPSSATIAAMSINNSNHQSNENNGSNNGGRPGRKTSRFAGGIDVLSELNKSFDN